MATKQAIVILIAMCIFCTNGLDASKFQDISTEKPLSPATTYGGVLSSLPKFKELRANAPKVVREEGSHVDLVTTQDGDEFALCHISFINPFTFGDFTPRQHTFEDAAGIALATHHLNTRDPTVIPELERMKTDCPNLYFTVEFADTEFAGGPALARLMEQINRNVTGPIPVPTAFVATYRSAVCIPMAIVTGLLGYPQVSGSATSADLDDVSQYPLFGRMMPSDHGNAIPIMIYMRNVLNITHLAVININDAFGNAYVEGMRMAAETYAPDMQIYQIPLDEGPQAIKSATDSFRLSKFRYVFGIFFSVEVHDSLMKEAYEQGVVGNGMHTWLFADSFGGTLDNRVFEKDSPLHLAYRGTGLFEATGGVKGEPRFDAFSEQMTSLRNEYDLEYLSGLFPKHNDSRYVGPGGPGAPIYDDGYLTKIHSVFSSFNYEAVISLGLGACDASKEKTSFTGQQHFDHYKRTTFTGVSGNVRFNTETGSRDPSSTFYKVSNYYEEDFVDSVTQKTMVRFKPVITSLFQDGSWNKINDYYFNDLSTTPPPDLPPRPVAPVATSDSVNLGLLIGVPVAAAFIVIALIFLFYENKRKQNDAIWEVKNEELHFADPPEVVGRGTFGLVYLAEYRGTQVAVKRVIPPKSTNAKNSSNSNKSGSDSGMDESGHASTSSGVTTSMPDINFGSADYANATNDNNIGMKSTQSNYGMTSGTLGMSSWANASLAASGVMGRMISKNNTKTNDKLEATTYKKLKKDFIEEMRYLSKLRHPCVTTVMGAITEKRVDPMLIMEYMDHGSLYDLLHNETMIMEGELILNMLRDVSQGMRFLHSADPQVLHGDLKAQNILVDGRFRAKVADFGLSQKKNLGGTGTPFWMAPELLRKESSNTAATDVYSFGIILYELYSRKDPYDGEDPTEVLRLVADQKVQKRPPVPIGMPAMTQSLMGDCVKDDPELRPSFEEIDIRVKRVEVENVELNLPTATKKMALSLFDIFPRHVAEALQEGRRVEAEHRDCVTIFFSDIVGFTNMSSTLDPRKVANMLDRLYLKFDALSSKHDVFKVETIGDAYMGVTNLVKDQENDHVKRIAEFAIDAIQAANETYIDEDDPELGCLDIRVGFHSGAVVADVVGNRNPRYCLFGDTVNTSSRMESNSKPGRIHCSKDAAELLRIQAPAIPLKSRGMINIKGKGFMQTFWVNHKFKATEREVGPADNGGLTNFLATADINELKSWVAHRNDNGQEHSTSLPAQKEEESADNDPTEV